VIIIGDGNNLAWAGFYALSQAMAAESPERKTRAALLGLTQTFLGIIARGGEAPTGRAGSASTIVSQAVIAFDQGRALRRRSIFPAYQTGRELTGGFLDNEPFVTDAIKQFIAAAGLLPVTVLQNPNTEADDLIAAYTLRTDSPVRIASSDRDFYQLVGPRISIYSPIKKLVIDDSNFDEMVLPRAKDGAPLTFPRERFVDFRALCGDPSDDLPGLPGAGPITAAQMLAYAPLDDFFRSPGLLKTATGRASRKLEAALWSEEGRAIIERNRQLMDLREGASHITDLAAATRTGTWDEAGFRSWLESQRIGRVDTDAALTVMARLANQAKPG